MTYPPVRQTPDDAIYNALVDAARAGRRCPTNFELAGLIGSKSIATPVRVMARLSRAGKIVVNSGNSARVVDIPAFGIGTAGMLPSPHWRVRRGQRLQTHERPRHGEVGPAQRRSGEPRPKLTAAEIRARVVSRDPCPRCGVRGDIGCPHRRPD